MAQKTPNYNLNKPGYEDFGDVDALNENFDKIDDALNAVDPTKITAKAAPADGDGVMIADSADGGKAKRLLWSSVKTALGKLFVPLARKVNGKALTKDVTLTAADIKMPDSDEDVGAAMAKRLINYGTEFASKDTILDAVMACETSCSFFAYAGSRLFDAADRPERGGEFQYLVLIDDMNGPRRTVIAYTYSAGNVYLRSVWNAKWQSDGWFFLANRISPDIHELPLVDDWSPITDKCTYFKTQENIVTVNIRAQHSTTIVGTSRETIATLPTGFRPVGWISGACALDVADSGGAIHGSIHVDASGSVIINSFDSYRVVYAQISFLAAN